jgi:hypothetical protein
LRLGVSKQVAGKTAAGSGGAAKPSQIQVIFNGKISTPQSLLPRKEHAMPAKKLKTQARDVHIAPTIDEADSPDKFVMLKNQKRKLSMNTLLRSVAAAGEFANKGKSGEQKDEEYCTIRLTETETSMLFSMTSFITPSDTREVKEVEERNARYDALVIAHRNSDSYVPHSTQTMNNPLKNQNDMISPNAVQDFECQANPYDIKDTYIAIKTGVIDQEGGHLPVSAKSAGTDTNDDGNTGYSISVRKFISETVSVSTITPGCLLDPNDLTRPRHPTDARKEGNVKDTSRSRAGRSRVIDPSHGDDGVSKSYAVDAGGKSGANNSDYPVGNTSNDGRSSGNIDDRGARDAEHSTDVSGIVSESNPGIGMSNPGAAGSSLTYVQKDAEEILRERQAQETLAAPMLLKRLQMLERAVQQNAYHRYHLNYRDLPDLAPLSLVDSDDANKADGVDPMFSSFGGFVLNKQRYNAVQDSRTNQSSFAMDSEVADQQADKNGVKLLFRYSNDVLVQGK